MLPTSEQTGIPVESSSAHVVTSTPHIPLLSTYWVPLDEAIHQWADFGKEATLATALSAIGHAFFALSHERRALRCYTRGWHHHWRMCSQQAAFCFDRTGQQLHEAAHHWSRVVYLLDEFAVEYPLAPDDLDRVRALSRCAKAQQERLWALTYEVRHDLQAAGVQQASHPEQEATR